MKLESVIKNLKATRLWTEHLEQDCKDGKVFLAIRGNAISFYHKGGKLFEFGNNEFKTHKKYASVIKSENVYIAESELLQLKIVSDFADEYGEIQKNCSKHSGSEAIGVSDIYHKHSYLSGKKIVVLDIEISMEAQEDDRNQDRIDLLLFDTNTGTLKFVEAKHFSNSEIWSTKKPKVIKQIERYEKQITNKKKKEDIILKYTNYIKILNEIFGYSLPTPKGINEKVKLLILGFDKDQKFGRLQELILKNPEYKGIEIYAKGDTTKIDLKNLWEINDNKP